MALGNLLQGYLSAQRGNEAATVQQYGNPAGNPYAQSLTIDALYDKYGSERDRLAGYGGLTQYNAAAPGAAGTAINAEGSVYGDIGYGIGNVMNPQQQTLSQLLRQYGVQGGSV